jgi:hypothetical protein
MYPVEVEAAIRSRRVLFGSFLWSVLLAVVQFSAFATGSVTLAWNPSTDPIVAGYNIYYGGASGTYTNKIRAGNATNATISGLVQGATYYFAATTYTASNVESSCSSEVSYQIPLNAPIMSCSNAYTAVVITNTPGFFTNRFHQIMPKPLLSTNYIFNGFWINFPPSGAWTLQSSSNLVKWVDYTVGTNAVFIRKTAGNWFFRFKSS